MDKLTRSKAIKKGTQTGKPVMMKQLYGGGVGATPKKKTQMRIGNVAGKMGLTK